MKRLILLLLVLAASVSAQVDLRGFGSPYWESSGDSVVMKAKWAYLDLDGQVIIVDSMHVITILADTLFSVYDTTQIAIMDSIYGAGGELIMDTNGNLVLLGWIDADSLNSDHLVINAEADIDSTNTVHLVVGADATIDSLNADHAIVNGQVDADSMNTDHLVVNTTVDIPAGSLEAADIALAQDNILVGNVSGQAAAGTDLPTATTIGTAYIYRVGGTDVADADVVDALTISGGTVNNSPVGASVASTGAFTTLKADSLDIDGGVLRVSDTEDSVSVAGKVVVSTYVDADSLNADHLVVNTSASLPAGSLEAADIALAQDNILVGNVSGQAAAGTDLPTATTIGSAYVYRAGGTDVADADVVDALTISGGTVNNSVIGGVTPAAGTFTKVVANDSLRIEKTSFFKGNVTLKTGQKLLFGTLQWTASSTDSIDGLKLAADDFGDVAVDDGVWAVKDDSHDHATTISGKAANVSDADFGDVTVSTGAWAVEDDSHNHTTASSKFVISDSLRVGAGVFVRNMFQSITGDSVGVIWYNTIAARIDTVWMTQ